MVPKSMNKSLENIHEFFKQKDNLAGTENLYQPQQAAAKARFHRNHRHNIHYFSQLGRKTAQMRVR